MEAPPKQQKKKKLNKAKVKANVKANVKAKANKKTPPHEQKQESYHYFHLVPATGDADGMGGGGWEDLLDALTDDDVRSEALSPDARLDIDAYIQSALPAAGRNTVLMSKALRALVSTMRPHIVNATDFSAAVAELALYIMTLLLSPSASADDVKDPRRIMIFVCEKSEGGKSVKSNLWIFMLLMREIRRFLSHKSKQQQQQWHSIKGNVYLMTSSGDTPVALPACLSSAHKSMITLIATDDCAYSGSQLQGTTSAAQEKIHAAFGRNDNIKTVICPVYSTFTALRRIQNASSSMTLKQQLFVPRTVGYSVGIAASLYDADVVLCVRRSSSSRWAAMSLFQLLGVARHYAAICHSKCKVWIEDNPVTFDGKALRLETDVAGHAATVFAHKVADVVSVPTKWFLQGPTLRHLIQDLDQLGSSNSNNNNSSNLMDIELLVLPLPEFIRTIDYDPAKAPRGMKWAQSQFSGHFWVDSKVLLLKTDRLTTIIKGTELRNMPEFMPLLQPPGACGDLLKAVQNAASDGDWWESSQMTNLMWKLESDNGDSSEQTQEERKLRCVSAPYKSKLRDRLLAVLAAGRGKSLGDALGITA